jgi:hypothetical protein
MQKSPEKDKKGILTQIISDCKVRHDLSENASINEESIRQQVKRGTKSGSRGTKSPMTENLSQTLCLQSSN